MPADLARVARLLEHALSLHDLGEQYAWQARYPVRDALAEIRILQQQQQQENTTDEQHSISETGT